MMKNTRIAVSIVLFLLGCSATLAAGTSKFRASGPDGARTGHYVITLNADASAEDLAAMKQEVTVLYGAALEDNASAGVRQFAAAMSPAHAKLLSSDTRVSELAELAATTPAPTPSSARHFMLQPSGYGDDGQSGTYTYDSSGNITAVGADTFLYDAESRLTQAAIRGVTETYVYDAFGNRKSATGATNCLGQSVCAQPVTVDKTTNRLMTINGAAVHYDPPGNMAAIDATVTSPATVYQYDGTEMMTESTVASDDRQYVYTADDERIAVKRGASWTWTVRDLGNKVLREFTSVETTPAFTMTTRTWVKDYVWRDGLLLATTTPTGTLHYHLDHLGTPRLITDANRLKVAEHAYYPFGAEIALTPHEAPEEAMKFTGHERDIVAGDGHTLDYMHARYYNPTAGRFLTVDPEMNVDKLKTQPQAWNRYAYIMNNPINRTDPNGRCFWDVCVGEALVGAAILTAATAYVVAPSAVVPGKTNGQVLVDTTIGGFQALGHAVGSLLPGRQPTSLPPPPPPTTLSRPTTPGTQATTGVNPAAPTQASGERNPAQDKLLTNGDIRILQNAGHDIHELKGGENASKYDLYKDTAGNVYVKPKGGKGPGDETGINIKDLQHQ